jgi:putative endonuclease
VNDGNARGEYWERFAARYLSRHGIRILARRYRCRFGEIDLIGRKGDCLIVIEVKARRQAALVSALDSVDRRKQHRILRTTRYFLANNQQLAELSIRIDVVAIDGIDTATPKVQWIRNAVEQT